MFDAAATAEFVQRLLALPVLLMGVSHVVQPALWRRYFNDLGAGGRTAVITRSFLLELWPAAIIVAFQQVWSGWAVILTVYGHLRGAKVSLSLRVPSIGLRSLEQAERGDAGFRAAGVVLIGLGLLCLALLAG